LRGTVRGNASIEWLPQASTDWSTTVLGKNAKHTDTNGDGVINANDTLAISRNYAKTHTYHLRARSAAPLLYVSNLPAFSTEGNWVTANVNLGSVTDKANDVYALLFSIQYDTSKIKTGSLSLKFDTCWLGQSNQRLTMTKDIGRMYVGIVRTTGTNISGNGVIGQLRFQLKDAVLGKAQISLLDGVLINNSGVKQELAAKYDTLTVKLTTPPTINVLAGASQTALINKPFASPFKIQLKHASGKVLPNVLIRFTLPNGNTPSATFINGQKTMSSLTNTEGVAQSLNFVANSLEGTYNATIMVEDSTFKLIPLMNTTTTAITPLEDSQLSVFPNPFIDNITLKRKGANDNSPCFWALYDIVGRQISKGQLYSESINISLSQYPAQVFILKTLMNGKNGVYKLERLP
jgi:hypothetical protein